MKQLAKIIFAVSFIAVTCGMVHAEVVDRVIAIVNDDIVTLKDFEAFVKVEKRTTDTHCHHPGAGVRSTT